MLRQHIKDYFTFSHAERRGLIFLFVVIIFILAIRIFYPLYRRSQPTGPDEFMAAAERWLKDSSGTAFGALAQEKNTKVNNVFASITPFDPNTINAKSIGMLNISEKAKKSWIKYLQSGGKFYKKSDMKKLYGLDSVSYSRLEPYISIRHSSAEEDNITGAAFFEKTNTIEVNSAIRSDFEKLYGIGPVLSERIISYRMLLGGFVNTGQLCEVYGLADSILSLNAKRITIDKQLVKKIDINKAVYNDIAKHPYFTGYHARAILAYRKLNGSLISVDQMRENNLLPDSVLNKAAEYLHFSMQ
ncbi:MAG: helix-hairpin-helix domain-containing protein [Bacteroidales bacterium]